MLFVSISLSDIVDPKYARIALLQSPYLDRVMEETQQYLTCNCGWYVSGGLSWVNNTWMITIVRK